MLTNQFSLGWAQLCPFWSNAMLCVHIEASQFWPKIKQSQVVLLIFSHLYLLTRSVVDRHNFAHFGQMRCFVDPRRPVIFGQMASLCHTFHLVDSHLRSCCHRKLYLGNPGTYRLVSKLKSCWLWSF